MYALVRISLVPSLVGTRNSGYDAKGLKTCALSKHTLKTYGFLARKVYVLSRVGDLVRCTFAKTCNLQEIKVYVLTRVPGITKPLLVMKAVRILSCGATQQQLVVYFISTFMSKRNVVSCSRVG